MTAERVRVEAAARARYERENEDLTIGWMDLAEVARVCYREEARADLAAADEAEPMVPASKLAELQAKLDEIKAEATRAEAGTIFRTWSEDIALRDRAERAARELAEALRQIGHFDAFQGGPIAPRENPTTSRMRRVALEALAARLNAEATSQGQAKRSPHPPDETADPGREQQA